nr:hypothetical protein [Ehrlichia canis]
MFLLLLHTKKRKIVAKECSNKRGGGGLNLPSILLIFFTIFK